MQQPVFFGTPVTVESFAEWKRNFQAEMASGKSTKQDASKKRLSGKLCSLVLYKCVA